MSQAPPPDVETATEPVRKRRVTETGGGSSRVTFGEDIPVSEGDTVRITVTTSPIDTGESEFQAQIGVTRPGDLLRLLDFNPPPGSTNITRELTVSQDARVNGSIKASNGTIVGALEIFRSDEDVPPVPEGGEDTTPPPPGVERPVLPGDPGPIIGIPEPPPPGDVPEEGGQDPGQIPECQEQQTRDFTLPFGVLNNIPGVSGVDDVTLSIPTIAGIVCSIKQALPTLEQIRMVVRAEARDALQGVPAPVVEVDETLFGTEIENLPELITEGILQELPDIPTIEDIDEALDRVIEDITEELPEVDLSPIEDAQEAIEDVQEDIEELDPLGDRSLSEAFLDLLEDSVDDVPGLNLLLNPGTFIDNQIDRVTDGLVDEDVLQELEDEVDRIQEERGGS